jgi:peptide/nickel transport system permease protein
MITFVFRRLLQAIPVIIGVTLITFLLTRILPGDLADVLLGPTASEESRQQLRTALGLDRSLPVQYVSYMSQLLHGDLGQSLIFAQPVGKILAARLANTALLAVSAIILASLVGIAVGTWVALKPGSPRDHVLGGAVLFLNSMPPFWLGLVLIFAFALKLRWLPASGMNSVLGSRGIGDLIAHMVLPTLTLAAWSLAVITRMTRSALLDVIDNDFILQTGFLLSGAVLTETVFSWPGIGLAMYQSISARDIPFIQGGILLLALIFVLVNLVVDALYAYLNPKIELQ